ncbi:hypothetical protein E3T23_06565 [Cryobacterium cheniae]|uniref:Uncharacterized protein n=1 Tax=Cryobacterium cheniae TaxID=1259262 RepID=A0A4R8XQ45_9MICO|nr:hypothetical protein [Cryobacterium cheniae]TFC81155.1 hypothetical protein E3T23_06565 [Cryobacterium cheniae]
MLARLKAVGGLLLVLAGFGLGLGLVSVPLSQTGKWFLALPPQTMAVVASVSALLIVPIITYFTTKSLEQGKSRENAVRQQKTEFYDRLIQQLISTLGIASGGKATSDEMLAIFASVPAPLLTFGSGGVIRAWNHFTRVGREKSGDTKAVMIAFEGLLRAIRNDLGHKDFLYEKGELIGVFLKDANTVFGSPKKASVPVRQIPTT